MSEDILFKPTNRDPEIPNFSERIPEKSEIDSKIQKYLKIADKIPFEVFIDHLNLDSDFVINHLDEWGKKYNFIIIDNKIVKIK